jgi:hypothetical protein
MQKEAFGTGLGNEDKWNDRYLQEIRDMVFMDLDAELKVLSGETTSMLRLGRFSAWYTDRLYSELKYEQELERILKVRSISFIHFNEPV